MFLNKKYICGFLLGIFLFGQVAIVSTGLFIPKPAEAFSFSLGLTVPTSDIPTIIQRIIIGIARFALQKFTDKFLRRFTDKLVDRYKIRNFLYYDRVLSSYYLSNLIIDNVDDPDLQQLYLLLHQGYITGQHYYTGGPDPREAIIPQIKESISDYYLNHTGGVDPDVIYNPRNFESDSEYFDAGMAYFYSPPSFTEQNLRGQFGSFQSNSTTASQLEVLVGNGLKAGRIIGGSCDLGGAPKVANDDYYNNPANCKAAGGTWNESLLDKARSFIDNPSRFVTSHVDSAIRQHFENSFNPTTDFWTQVGGLLGSFIWSKFAINKNNYGDAAANQSGVLSDDPRGYNPELYSTIGQPTNTYTDGSVNEKGIDYDGDGVIDICNNGGTPPTCEIPTPPYQAEYSYETPF